LYCSTTGISKTVILLIFYSSIGNFLNRYPIRYFQRPGQRHLLFVAGASKFPKSVRLGAVWNPY
jgi:hypothetical protein